MVGGAWVVDGWVFPAAVVGTSKRKPPAESYSKERVDGRINGKGDELEENRGWTRRADPLSAKWGVCHTSTRDLDLTQTSTSTNCSSSFRPLLPGSNSTIPEQATHSSFFSSFSFTSSSLQDSTKWHFKANRDITR